MFGPEIELIECQHLYNMLNESMDYPRLSDPYYLYLIGKINSLNLNSVGKNDKLVILVYIDCRPRGDYNQGHIICAKNIKTVEFVFFCSQYTIVYFCFFVYVFKNLF